MLSNKFQNWNHAFIIEQLQKFIIWYTRRLCYYYDFCRRRKAYDGFKPTWNECVSYALYQGRSQCITKVDAPLESNYN